MSFTSQVVLSLVLTVLKANQAKMAARQGALALHHKNYQPHRDVVGNLSDSELFNIYD